MSLCHWFPVKAECRHLFAIVFSDSTGLCCCLLLCSPQSDIFVVPTLPSCLCYPILWVSCEETTLCPRLESPRAGCARLLVSPWAGCAGLLVGKSILLLLFSLSFLTKCSRLVYGANIFKNVFCLYGKKPAFLQDVPFLCLHPSPNDCFVLEGGVCALWPHSIKHCM